MGRYYNGDIEGKFWFGIQSSDDADFFGFTGQPPTNELCYEFEEEHIPIVEAGIRTCNERLGDYKQKLDTFFKENNAYDVSKALELSVKESRQKLKWYARLRLGKQILDCLKDQKYCYFTAEC
jgi:hypothetical protein|tara:strand:- start:475 stop:843 length:369 start_codon:yes stop_codon:yes gene_type:complete